MRDLAFRIPPRYRVVWLALAALIVLGLVTAPDVFNGAAVQLVTALAGVLAIAAAGQLLVVMSGGIDLSVPAVMTLAGALIVKHTGGDDGSLAVALLLLAALALVIGLVNGLLVAVLRLNALIVTLAMGGIVAGATLLWAGATFSATGRVPPALARLGEAHIGPISVLAIVGIVVLAVLAAVLRGTAAGRGFVAAGSNRVAAEVIGVRVVRCEVIAYVGAALLYAIAGTLLAGLLKSPDYSLGEPYMLATIIAVALGGASLAGGPASLACTAAGCVFVALLRQYLDIEGFSAGVKQLADGIVLVVAVALVTVGTDAGARIRSRLSRLRGGRHGGGEMSTLFSMQGRTTRSRP